MPDGFRSLEEQTIYYTLSLTWVWYFLGAMYMVPPVIGWLLATLWLKRVITGEQKRGVPYLIVIWWAAMLIMEVALIVGHLNWSLGIPTMIKSSVGWAKGWALMGVFGLIGGAMQIRADVLSRAATNLAIQTLILIPLFVVAPIVGIAGTLYHSPLMVLGGPGPEYFEIQLYSKDFSGAVRWSFFAPWAPAAAVAFGVLAPLILRDKSLARRTLGLLAVVMVVLMSKSRLGMVSIPISLAGAMLMSQVTRPKILFAGAVLALAVGLMGEPLHHQFELRKAEIGDMRADSTFVRAALERIALYRWRHEAPVWGHGVVEPGPAIVEEMPIGSHHSWYGLLFVKGVVGFIALLVPLVVSFLFFFARSQKSRNARTALGIILFFILTTFTENVEMLAYMMWPAFVMFGIAARERFFNPFRHPLGLHDPNKPSTL
ncbi:MAG: O-antigen ligase family protein [Hyphomicrobiaceae bacterium]